MAESYQQELELSEFQLTKQKWLIGDGVKSKVEWTYNIGWVNREFEVSEFELSGFFTAKFKTL